MYRLVRVHIGNCLLSYYTDMFVELEDKVVVETKFGPVVGTVKSIGPGIKENPFNSKNYKAKCHVLENVTKKLYDEEIIIMAKTVEVRHISSNRKTVLYSDLPLSIGDHVVYERSGNTYDKEGTQPVAAGTCMSVGVVINADPEAVTARYWVVDRVDMVQHQARQQRIREATKLKARLDAKRKQFQDIEVLRLIAQTDPETKEMLDNYMALVNNHEAYVSESLVRAVRVLVLCYVQALAPVVEACVH